MNPTLISTDARACMVWSSKNVEAYPKLWVSYDTLAEAYLKSGNKELAVKNYQTSLELQPFNDGTRHILKTLGVELPAKTDH